MCAFESSYYVTYFKNRYLPGPPTPGPRPHVGPTCQILIIAKSGSHSCALFCFRDEKRVRDSPRTVGAAQSVRKFLSFTTSCRREVCFWQGVKCGHSSLGWTMDDAPTVIVIGAGAAGLSAARELTRAGAHVTVLEARSRLGGRMDTRTMAEGSIHVDMGAAWAFGVDGEKNPVTPAALCTEGAFFQTDWDNTAAWEAVGTLEAPSTSPGLSTATAKESANLMRLTRGLFSQAQSASISAATKVLGRDGANLAADQSVWATLCQLKSKRFPGVSALDERQQLLLRYAWAQESEHDYAASMECLSTRWWDADVSQEEDMSLWRDGYCTLAEHWAADLPDVRLDQCVRGVTVRDEKSSLPPASARGRAAVDVHLTSGATLHADACVVTLPLGVLKAGSVAFDPPLSPEKASAIARLGVGLLNKVAVRFEHCFWASGGAPAAPEAEPHVLLRVPTEGARATPEALEAPFVINLRPATGANVLVAYFACETAACMERQSDEALRAHVLALLGSMYSAEVVKSANALECFVSRWAADPFACGSYSYVATGATPLDRVALARPEPPLFFAGEATSHGSGRFGEGGFAATVYGAHLSGKRAASEAAQALGLGDKSAAPRRRRSGRGRAKHKTPSGNGADSVAGSSP